MIETVDIGEVSPHIFAADIAKYLEENSHRWIHLDGYKTRDDLQKYIVKYLQDNYGIKVCAS